jgi:hypothetical protein
MIYNWGRYNLIGSMKKAELIIRCQTTMSVIAELAKESHHYADMNKPLIPVVNFPIFALRIFRFTSLSLLP